MTLRIALTAVVILTEVACRPAQAPPAPADPLTELRRLLPLADATAPLARAACEALDGEPRARCKAGLAVGDAARKAARAVLVTADACEVADEACLATALEEARGALAKLRGGAP